MAKHSIPPCGAVLRALVSQQHNTWLLNLCELIDNSWDADATRVDIEWGPVSSYFKIEDDGSGRPRLDGFFRLGQHEEHLTTEIGMFGVGGTMAQAWICEAKGGTLVRSTHRGTSKGWAGDDGDAGVTRAGRCDWEAILESGEWAFEDVEADRPARPGETGTIIEVSPCAKRIPDRGERFDNLVRELGFTYAIALRAGSQIKLRRNPSDAWTLVAPWSLPKLEPGSIDVQIRVGNRHANVCVGIVPEGEPNPKAGLTYYFGRRAITTTSRGCGDYSTGRIAGTVELLGKNWPVTTNKNDFREGEITDALFAAVYDAIHPLLLVAKQKTMELHVEALTQDLSSLLNGLVEEAKAKRGKKTGKRGTVEPTGDGTGHSKAETEQDGKRFRSKRGSASCYKIDPQHFGKDDPKLAKWDAPRTVALNLDHPWVKLGWDRGDRESLLSIAAVVIAHEDKSLRANGSLTGADDLMSVAGNILRRRMTMTLEPAEAAPKKRRA